MPLVRLQPARLFRSTLSILVVTYLAFGAYLYVFQRTLLYFPTAEAHIAGQPYMTVQSGQEQVKVWVQDPGRASAIFYFGGNAEAVESNLDEFIDMFPDQTVYVVNYSGFGGSTGSPSELRLFVDALAIYDAVSGKHSSISVIGRSLGTGVGVYLAANRNIDKLVLVTPYDSIASVASGRYPYYPVAMMLKDPFDSAAIARQVNAKILVVAAQTDHIVPSVHTQKLIQAFGRDRVQVETIAGTTHNSISHAPAYTALLKDFLQQ